MGRPSRFSPEVRERAVRMCTWPTPGRLVMYASVISLTLLASAALSMGEAFVALTWEGIAERRPATRDPWSYDYRDRATRAAERNGINGLTAGL
jgi:hypothetical protein